MSSLNVTYLIIILIHFFKAIKEMYLLRLLGSNFIRELLEVKIFKYHSKMLIIKLYSHLSREVLLPSINIFVRVLPELLYAIQLKILCC